ncbi:capsid protein [Sewage-associated circular DNA virus-11]|uniref:capsid protein n=1 Tax=Sewage-associated circular DNA virus-11 TaxID=1519387 RepID=UPI0004D12791|nr:capsid protein [Sewage-associated circular DNA virus-11]AIF34800.1 capsid protein [Sewage-associated circular DNA virus-11]
MKRQRSAYEIENRKQAARAKRRALVAARAAPMRAYANSQVPLRSGGYRFGSTEKKVFDLDTGTTNINTTGSVLALFVPTLGTDMTNRIGRKAIIKSFYLRGYVRCENSLTPTSPQAGSSQQLRIIVLIDMQPNGALPAITDILKEQFPSSQLNINNRDRFKILKDKTYALDTFIYNTTATQAVGVAGRTLQNFKCYKKMNLEVIFNSGNAGTIADTQTGALLIATIGSTASGTADGNLVMSSRIRFLDP